LIQVGAFLDGTVKVGAPVRQFPLRLIELIVQAGNLSLIKASLFRSAAAWSSAGGVPIAIADTFGPWDRVLRCWISERAGPVDTATPTDPRLFGKRENGLLRA
jgi:hypothetical protein